jgi:uncharacterized lipoprotein YajG
MKYMILLSALVLAGCQEDEQSCYERNDKALSNQGILDGDGVFLTLIYINEDTSACDFTVLGGSLYKK